MWFFQAFQKILPVPELIAKQVESFCIDSRKATPKSCFFALQGDKVDGHDYLESAARNGAIIAVIDRPVSRSISGLHLITCSDVKKTLQEIAKAIIEFWKPKIIAITGSLGKTSTKDFLVTLLRGQRSLSATPGNYNSQLTLPLTILNVKQPTDFLILEMGLDRPGEIDRLLEIAPPTYAVLTMLSHAHIEAFESFRHLALEKMKVFAGAKTVLYNADMPFEELAAQKCPKGIRYSMKDPQAPYFLKRDGNAFVVYKNQKLFFKSASPFFDEKSHLNLLGAIAIADQLQVSCQEIQENLSKVQHAQNRLECIEKQGVLFICDAYNATIDSVENALQSLQVVAKGRTIAILSDLVEQGEFSFENHQKLVKMGVEYADILIGYGSGLDCMPKLCKNNKKKWAFFQSYPNMVACISQWIQKGDTVLLKGSRKRALERVIHDIRFS